MVIGDRLDFKVRIGQIPGQQARKHVLPAQVVLNHRDALEIPPDRVDGGRAQPMAADQALIIIFPVRAVGKRSAESIDAVFPAPPPEDQLMQAEIVLIVDGAVLGHQLHDRRSEADIVIGLIEPVPEQKIQRRSLRQRALPVQQQKLYPVSAQYIPENIPQIHHDHRFSPLHTLFQLNLILK